jgi:hypothetical protein
LWKGSTVNAFTITIPPGVKVLKITTENTYVNEFVDPNLPRYIGVTGGKTYNMRFSVYSIAGFRFHNAIFFHY